MFGDLDWPLNALRGFVSISWASCCVKSAGYWGVENHIICDVVKTEVNKTKTKSTTSDSNTNTKSSVNKTKDKTQCSGSKAGSVVLYMINQK